MIKRVLVLAVMFFALSINAQTDSTATNDKDTVDHDASFNIPVFSTTAEDLDNDMNTQDVSSLLQASKDVYTNYSSFHFAPANFRMRGYQAENQTVLVNGVNVNNLETGYSSWSSWAGLNDVTRYVETRIGLNASRLTFGGAGGYTNIDSKASSFKKGTRISYSSANRAYQHRVMITHSTGMMKNGWAITVSASSRYGDATNAPPMWSPGTYFNSYSYYISIDKRINDKHMLSFTGFGAPTEQGRKSNNIQLVYDLAGSNYYNSNWGYQNGQVRNAKVSTTHKPMFMLSHIFNITPTSKLTTSVFYTFGNSGLTGVNFYDAPNPRPDYYKYLPNYYYQTNPGYADQLTYNWQNDVNTRQINWDQFYFANSKNLYTVQDANGVKGSTYTGMRSKYILENAHTDIRSYGLNSVYNTRIKKLFFTAGVNANIFQSHHYKVIEDLLGGEFYLDYDMFAKGLSLDGSTYQNNIETPNKVLKKGDIFGYNYNINLNRFEGWAQGEYSLSKLDLYLSLSASGSMVNREGLVSNGKFPSDSKGMSATKSFFNYGVKGGATYKLNGRNFLSVNGAFITRAPDFQNIFVSPITRNDYINPIKSEEVQSFDVSYIAKLPNFKARITYYNTAINNQTYLRSYFHDEYNTIVNYVMTGVNTSNQGLEIGLEGKILTRITLTGVLGYGEYIYTNRPLAQAWLNNTGAAQFTDRTVYLKNYRVGNMPQTVAGGGIKYSGKNFWFVGVNFNYFADMYIEPNPDRRTAEAVDKYMPSDPQWNQLIDQEKLPDNYTIDANAGKSFRIAKKYSLNINLSVSNLTNNQKFRVGGSEQLRFDKNDPNKFPNKYSYMLGITYMANVSFGF